MENTLLISLSRQVALRRELDVIANNMANINTGGFKADNVVFESFLMPVAKAEDFEGADRRFSYPQDRLSWVDFRSGDIQTTGNRLDVAVEGESFLAVETPQGERYSRNGAFQINAQGELVTSDGFPVLGEGGKITLDPQTKEIIIGRDGTISTEAGPVNRLRLVEFDAPSRLTKEGSSLFNAPADMQPQVSVLGRVQQGALERSNVQPVMAMSRMIEVSRAYQSLASLMERQQDLRRTAIERLADVPN